MRTVTQYAYALAGRRMGRWHLDRREASKDALREGHAQRDRYSGNIYVTVPAEIITRQAEPPMEDELQLQIERDFAPPPRLRLVA